MPRLVDTFVAFDAAVRAYAQAVGQSRAARRLAQATAALRRDLAAAALADQAQRPDPKADFATLVDMASAAGLGWQDMAAIINRAGERNPRI